MPTALSSQPHVALSEIGIRKPRHNHKDTLVLLRQGEVVTLPTETLLKAEKLRASLISSLRRWIRAGERLSTTVLQEHPEHRDPFPRVEAALEPYYSAHVIAPETQKRRTKRSHNG